MKKIFKRSKRGFTLIEVTLFLALSGFLMVGLIIGSNISISRQRYNDAINSFADFIRGVYSAVTDVSNDSVTNSNLFNGGRSTTAIYGKLITFGEFDNIKSPDKPTKNIYTYDVVGKAVSSSSVSGSSILNIIKNSVVNGGVAANIYLQEGCATAVGCHNTFYKMTPYTIPWESDLEKPYSVDCEPDDTSCRFSGAILIVRSPVTGNTRTYVYAGDVLDLHSYGDGGESATSSTALARFNTLLDSMYEADLDMCLDSDDNASENRRNIRILKSASNSTGVFLAELDSEYSDSNPNGSKCFGR